MRTHGVWKKMLIFKPQKHLWIEKNPQVCWKKNKGPILRKVFHARRQTGRPTTVKRVLQLCCWDSSWNKSDLKKSNACSEASKGALIKSWLPYPKEHHTTNSNTCCINLGFHCWDWKELTRKFRSQRQPGYCSILVQFVQTEPVFPMVAELLEQIWGNKLLQARLAAAGALPTQKGSQKLFTWSFLYSGLRLGADSAFLPSRLTGQRLWGLLIAFSSTNTFNDSTQRHWIGIGAVSARPGSSTNSSFTCFLFRMKTISMKFHIPLTGMDFIAYNI